MIQLKINDTQVAVEAGTTVLEAARRHGFAIPTLCYLKAMRANQACRLCVVEAESPTMPKAVFSSCDLIAAEGMVVQSESPRIVKIRGTILEMLLASMPDNKAVREIAHQHGITATRFGIEKTDNCLLCGLCIQACREKIGVSALQFAAPSASTSKVAETIRLDAEQCVGCGTCANLCPVGVIEVVDEGARRQLSLSGLIVNTLELIACRSCGTHFTTGRVADLLRVRLAKDGLEMSVDYCPKCAREINPPPSTAYSRMQNGEKA